MNSNSNNNNNNIDLILNNVSKSTDKTLIKEFLKKNDLATTKNSRNQTLLHLISMNDNLVAIKFILKKKYGFFQDKKIQLDLKDKDGYTPLHCAVNQGSFEISKKLLSRGADPNARTESGSTPLHLLSKFCYSNKSIKLAKQLIDSGAYINHKDGKQETPLHRATMSNDNLDYLKLLLYHGANPNIVDRRGRTCQHISIEQGKVDLLELFLMYGADFNKPTSILPSPMEMAANSPFPLIKQFFLERISSTGENILMIEKSVFLGKPTPTFVQSGDSFSTGTSIQLYTGKLYITNYRLVFKIDPLTPTSINSGLNSSILSNSSGSSVTNNNNNSGTQPTPLSATSAPGSPNSSTSSLLPNNSLSQISSQSPSSILNIKQQQLQQQLLNSQGNFFPLLEEEEEEIPLLSISSLILDDEKDNSQNSNSNNQNNSNNNNNENDQKKRESIIVPSNSINDFLTSEISSSGGDTILIDDYLINNESSTTATTATSNSTTTSSAKEKEKEKEKEKDHHHKEPKEKTMGILNNIINFGHQANLTLTTIGGQLTTLSPINLGGNSGNSMGTSNVNSSSSQVQILSPINSNNNNSNLVNSTGSSNIIMNYQLINIETKDFKQFKLYFMSQFLRDKILDLINYHFKIKIERSIKVNSQNKTIQKRIVEENIHMEDESRVEHIDRYESYGIFEETAPYLFAFLYKMPGFNCSVYSNINNSMNNNNNNGNTGCGTTNNSLSVSYNSGLDGWHIYNQRREYARFGVLYDDPTSAWRFTLLNKDHRMCSSYPSTLVVARGAPERDLEKIFLYRSKGRIPVLTWKDPNSNASISRCSQPLVGLERARCYEDEQYFATLASMAPSKQLYLIDARPKLNAIANAAVGGGYEVNQYYNNCKLVFMNIPNIHVIRKSLEKLLYSMRIQRVDSEGIDSKWWGQIDESGWISHIKSILEAATFCSDLILKGNSIAVHCSDGWDRTPQICSLTQILLDPFYRTIYGFEVLIEKEWLSFGHKFSLRLGHLPGNEEERSPIFQQFLDCVFQLLNQFPLLFEFTPALLLFISDHIHSCKYGTFLNNCEKDRITDQIKSKTVSIWTEINLNVSRFLNPYYHPQDVQQIRPKLFSRCLELWKSCYMRNECRDFWMSSNWLLHNNNFGNINLFSNTNQQNQQHQQQQSSNNNINVNITNNSIFNSPAIQRFQLPTFLNNFDNRSSISSISSNNSKEDNNWITQKNHHTIQSPILASHRPVSVINDINNNNNNDDNDNNDINCNNNTKNRNIDDNSIIENLENISNKEENNCINELNELNINSNNNNSNLTTEDILTKY